MSYPLIEVVLATTRECPGCGQIKNLARDFHNDRSTPTGKTYRCRECNNKAVSDYTARQKELDPEGFLARNAEASKGWRSRNEDYFHEYDRTQRKNTAWYARRGEYFVEYRERNPDKFQIYGALRRARKAGASVCEDVDRLAVAEMYDWICQWCFLPIDPEAPHLLEDGVLNPAYLHADHWIPLSKHGVHSYENSRPMHAECNWMKHDWYEPGEGPPPDRIPRRSEDE